jgi:Zn-finger nucleic acid-binding protein
MLCFRCRTAMARLPLDGVLVDQCPNCRGTWLDGGELAAMRDGARKPADQLRREAAAEVATERRRLTDADRMCPRCQRQPLQSERLAGIELDRCSACGGLHFDWGELERSLAAERQGFALWLRRLKNTLLG